MSVDKTVKRVKGLAEHKRYAKYPEIVQAQVKKDDGAEEIYSPDTDFLVLAANSIMPIITAYEQSQKEIERLQKTVDDNFVHDYNEEYDTTKLKAELETANKRIAELKMELDGVYEDDKKSNKHFE